MRVKIQIKYRIFGRAETESQKTKGSEPEPKVRDQDPTISQRSRSRKKFGAEPGKNYLKKPEPISELY